MKNWKYWVIRKMKPNNVKKAIVTDALAAVKRGLRNRLMSSIGDSRRSSVTMNAPNRSSASAKPVSVRALAQQANTQHVLRRDGAHLAKLFTKPAPRNFLRLQSAIDDGRRQRIVGRAQ